MATAKTTGNGLVVSDPDVMMGKPVIAGTRITVLFAGSGGTGKTMADKVLANERKLDLYRIDLSAVVSKYIGETEKNLRGVFDAAEEGGAVLLFDEADALFGKRSEVKDSHDRYANIEVSYLLQRMEAYRGLAILTTNMKQALDTAFLRRTRFVVQFPGPGQRAEIWRRIFPDKMPTEALDPVRPARLNIALYAAFMMRSGPVARSRGVPGMRRASWSIGDSNRFPAARQVNARPIRARLSGQCC